MPSTGHTSTGRTSTATSNRPIPSLVPTSRPIPSRTQVPIPSRVPIPIPNLDPTSHHPNPNRPGRFRANPNWS